MINKYRFLRFASLLVCLSISFVSYSQTTDFGAVIRVNYVKEINKAWNYSLAGEGQLGANFTSFDRLKSSTGFDFTFLKKRLKAAGTLDYLLKNEIDFFENRYRFNLSLTYTEKIKQFKISYRLRGQTTIYEETHQDHRFNPKTYLRNRLELSYEFFEKPVEIYASTEFFLRLYQPGANFVDAFRTILGVSYRFDKNNFLDVYFRADNDIQVKDPANVYYIGIAYTFKH